MYCPDEFTRLVMTPRMREIVLDLAMTFVVIAILLYLVLVTHGKRH